MNRVVAALAALVLSLPTAVLAQEETAPAPKPAKKSPAKKAARKAPAKKAPAKKASAKKAPSGRLTDAQVIDRALAHSSSRRRDAHSAGLTKRDAIDLCCCLRLRLDQQQPTVGWQ